MIDGECIYEEVAVLFWFIHHIHKDRPLWLKEGWGREKTAVEGGEGRISIRAAAEAHAQERWCPGSSTGGEKKMMCNTAHMHVALP